MRTFFRVSLILKGVFAVGEILAAVADPLTPDERLWLSQHDGQILLGHDPSAKPIEFDDETGNFRGLAADYIALLQKKLVL